MIVINASQDPGQNTQHCADTAHSLQPVRLTFCLFFGGGTLQPMQRGGIYTDRLHQPPVTLGPWDAAKTNKTTKTRCELLSVATSGLNQCPETHPKAQGLDFQILSPHCRCCWILLMLQSLSPGAIRQLRESVEPEARPIPNEQGEC